MKSLLNFPGANLIPIIYWRAKSNEQYAILCWFSAVVLSSVQSVLLGKIFFCGRSINFMINISVWEINALIIEIFLVNCVNLRPVQGGSHVF